jgi:hypothetical protein
MKQQTFDSAGPDIRVRGNAYQVWEKYLGLARDAQSAGDRIAAENFFQHAEHYYRLMNANGGDPATYNGRPRFQNQRHDENGYDDEQPAMPPIQGQERQGEMRQGETRQGEGRQGETRSGEMRQGEQRQGEARHGEGRRDARPRQQQQPETGQGSANGGSDESSGGSGA